MSDNCKLLIDQVRSARNAGKAVNIVGRGSKTFMGRRPAFPDTSNDICIAEHSGIVKYHPEELVVTVRAGTLVSELQSVLAEHKQTLSFEPPTFAQQASIGGTLACHLSGPGRPWLGSVRDMVLGTRVINGKAEHLRFGGEVIKNVAGYDVSRLQAGAMGTLGIITEISFKVLPETAASISLVKAMDAEEAIHVMNTLSGQAKPLTGACWLNGQLYLRLAGTKRAVESTASEWSGQVLGHADKFWHDLREQQLPFFMKQQSDNSCLWRFSIKSSADHFLPDANWMIDWAGAQRWLCTEHENVFPKAKLESFATASGGQVSLFRGGDRSAEVMPSQNTAMQALMKRVKLSFDPDGLFNRGRLYSWM